MDTLPNGEPSEQPAADTNTPVAGEQPQLGEPASQFDGLSQEALYELLETAESGESPRQPDTPAAPAAVAESKEPEPANEPEPEPEDEDTAPPATGEEGTQSTKPKGRLSVRSLPPEQQSQLAEALDLVRAGKATDISTALAQVTGTPVATAPPVPAAQAPTDTPAADTAPTQEAPPAPTPGDPADIQNRIKGLREQRRQAISDFDRETEAQLTEDIEDLQLELVRAEQTAQLRQVESRSYNESYAKAVEAVESKYEAAKDENSAFSRILDDRVAAAHARNDPSLADPGFITRFADEVAADLGLDKVTTPPPRAPARPARQVGSFAPGHGSAERLSTEAARKLIHEVPIEDLQRLAFTE